MRLLQAQATEPSVHVFGTASLICVVRSELQTAVRTTSNALCTKSRCRAPSLAQPRECAPPSPILGTIVCPQSCPHPIWGRFAMPRCPGCAHASWAQTRQSGQMTGLACPVARLRSPRGLPQLPLRAGSPVLFAAPSCANLGSGLIDCMVSSSQEAVHFYKNVGTTTTPMLVRQPRTNVTTYPLEDIDESELKGSFNCIPLVNEIL